MTELSEKAQKIFNMKYASKDGETWQEAAWRIANYVAQAEKQYGYTDEEIIEFATKFYRLIYDMYFIPGGRIVANAGTSIKNLFNCFVLGIDDSRDSIYSALKDAAEIFAHGGGVGYNFSHIREEGAKIKSTRGNASGPLSFMTLFDQTGEVIQQASRRGAQLGALNVDHPDIEKFISFKSVPNTRNMRLIDEYDRNLKRINEKLKETKYHKVLRKTLLDDQLTHFNISVMLTDRFMESIKLGKTEWELVSPTDNSVVKTINPQILLNQMAHLAWETGDPGVLFYDRINEDNIVPYVGNIEATNPCVTGDTKILTVYEGARTFKELAEEGLPVLVYAWNPITKLPVVRVMHNPRLTRKNVPILEIELDSGTKIRCTADHNFYSYMGKKVMAEDLVIGQSLRAFTVSIAKDGHLRSLAWVNGKSKHQYVSRMVWECFNGKIPKDKILHHMDLNKLNNRLENFELLTNADHSKIHFMYRTDGGLQRHNHKVIGIKEAGYADVYNGTVDDVHTYIIADDSCTENNYTGIVSANCGEVPLLSNESCNLGSINLSKILTSDNKIDFELLEHIVRTAIRFMDDVHDLSVVPLDVINTMNHGLRRLGLGVMGFSDLLAKLEIAYNSDSARQLANYLSWFISFMAWQESISLAKEKGSFSFYDKDKANLHIVDKVLNSKYNPNKFDMDEIRNIGLRNVSVTSIAPTGTIALLANVNSGIEPYFGLAYKRNITEGVGNVAKDYIVETNQLLLDKLQILDLSLEDYRETIDKVVSTGDLSECDKIPINIKNAFIVASQVSWEDHIRMQAAWQEYITNAVSKTINCSKDTEPEEIYKMYLFMWENKLKGSTIYRDGSRMFQVLEKGKK